MEIPIVLTFDSNMSFAAGVCISSIVKTAGENTVLFYILHAGPQPQIVGKDKILSMYPQTKIIYKSVGNNFENAFEIRGITSAAYYRLLAPELITEHSKVLYTDIDILFRRNPIEAFSIDFKGKYVGAVKAVDLNKSDEGRKYLKSIHLNPDDYYVSGFLVMDLDLMRADKLVEKFKSHAKHNYKYQDQDILNIVCKNRIHELPETMSLGASAIYDRTYNNKSLNNTENNDLLYNSNIHFNGVKPWNDLCPYMDIWWEFYRNSPVFDHKRYFNFYYSRMEVFDQLPLIKRIKILTRYFIIGKKSPSLK